MIYKWVRSEGVGGGWSSRGFGLFGTPPLEIFGAKFTKSQVYQWTPELVNCRLAPSLRKSVKMGGAGSLTKWAVYVSSVRMDDLECPYCLKQCDNRGNREKHVAACKKQRDTTQESQACPASHVRRTGQAAITTSWSAQLGARLWCGSTAWKLTSQPSTSSSSSS